MNEEHEYTLLEKKDYVFIRDEEGKTNFVHLKPMKRRFLYN